MQKVFLYLYPIKEYTDMFLFYDDKLYDEWNVARPLPILNSTINKRYREKGYQVVFVLYPDRELYGIQKYENDKIIFTDVTFDEASACDEYGNKKKDFIPTYPSEEFILQQLGNIDELVVGGYHVMSCVKRVAEAALESGIPSLIDLDLTDLFFNVYKNKEYFDETSYNPQKYKSYIFAKLEDEEIEFEKKFFEKNYSSPVYGYFNKEQNAMKILK